ncbi:short chain dehydrogenase [Photobacterium frigidiphilum]|uniref:Short chain dehydrogenase n=1 Tax=Photobacterium frigidiphilum TaxID=264736 RepID=A0A2T3JFK3_9GAMM|nr:SDR family oxidoreductase [Photobacterium frigidiphilum]PSU47693.1 short chain dehydrogenase [Photobacterium frigidiphilum]
MQRDKLLAGKVALISGITSGIGEATARLFSQQGASLVLVARNENKGQMLAEELNAQYPTLFIKADITQTDQVDRVFEQTMAEFGGIDCAFNNAGIDGSKQPISETSDEIWNQIINTNLNGTWNMLNRQLSIMSKQGHGTIVNMASICSVLARPNRAAYNTSRHAVLGLTRSAAVEYAKQGVRVNAVAPGAIDTPIFERSTQKDPQLIAKYHQAHPIGRIGQPSEVAEAALWLCSDLSSFVVGHTLMVDGGFSISG